MLSCFPVQRPRILSRLNQALRSDTSFESSRLVRAGSPTSLKASHPPHPSPLLLHTSGSSPATSADLPQPDQKQRHCLHTCKTAAASQKRREVLVKSSCSHVLSCRGNTGGRKPFCKSALQNVRVPATCQVRGVTLTFGKVRKVGITPTFQLRLAEAGRGQGNIAVDFASRHLHLCPPSPSPTLVPLRYSFASCLPLFSKSIACSPQRLFAHPHPLLAQSAPSARLAANADPNMFRPLPPSTSTALCGTLCSLWGVAAGCRKGVLGSALCTPLPFDDKLTLRSVSAGDSSRRLAYLSDLPAFAPVRTRFSRCSAAGAVVLRNAGLLVRLFPIPLLFPPLLASDATSPLTTQSYTRCVFS